MTDHSNGTGVYWEPSRYSPSWLGALFNPFGTDGGWEVSRGSQAETILKRQPEYKDAYKACMVYLKSGPTYQENAALHKAHGTLEEYHRTLEESAHDYAQRTCVNDHWHIGDDVGNPQHRCDDPQPPGYVPMRERIAQTAQPAAGRTAAPARTDAGAPWRRAQEVAAMDEHEPALSRGLEPA